MLFSFLRGSIYLLILLLLLTSCNSFDEQDSLFNKLSSEVTGITFSNDLSYNKELNPYTYRNFYNGGGVGVGDFNNDGLQDLFFTGNQVSNKLYLNEGGLKFKDITSTAGVESSGVWSTGVSIVDVNGDGWLDIYVCKSGSPGGPNRHNQLFINNGDSTFTDKAKAYGLDVSQLSVDATFFDYDRDGDLDMYLLNNSFKPVTDIRQQAGLRNQRSTKGGNKLFRNETISTTTGSSDSTIFTEVTQEAGIYNSSIGFGLDVLVGDVDRDNWPDIYVTNDFFERDYLYINNKDGSFNEQLPQMMQSISLSSMGGDIADINNDGYPDIFVSDMLPQSLARVKSKTVFDSWEEYQKRVNEGYHYQYVRNTLQLNQGPLPATHTNSAVKFSEVGRAAGVAATDWSWTTLFADFNNDGFNDLFVTNGVYKDLNDQDYLSNNQTLRKIRSIVEEDELVDILFDEIPSVPVPNYLFAGSDSLTFQNKAKEWGLGNPGFSNGAAYSDLDNDGDLDLVLNNVNSSASVYENNGDKIFKNCRQLTVALQGASQNTQGVGATVTAWKNGQQYYREQMPNRGFQSSVDPRIFIGFEDRGPIDSLVVQWPDDSRSIVEDIAMNQNKSLKIVQAEAKEGRTTRHGYKPIMKEVSGKIELDYRHKEGQFNAFKRNPLLYEMFSEEGPASCVGDINNDGRDDLYLGGAKGQVGRVYIQGANNAFISSFAQVFEADKESEDTDCVWFDADGDNHLDLYVTSGSYEFPLSSSALSDRLYLYNGTSFRRASNALPQSQFENAGTVKAVDFDNDGDTDLFTGTRLAPFAYGVPVSGHLLENNGKGQFKDISSTNAPGLQKTGMITDAAWTDYDCDGDADLVVGGEWMPVKLFQNQYEENGEAHFKDITDEVGLNDTNGLWKSITVTDIDKDGYDDIFAGNYGSNTSFSASKDQPLMLWVNDFDQNGSIESIITKTHENEAIPLVLKPDIINRMPRFENRILDFKSFATMRMTDLLTKPERENSSILTVVELQNMILWNNKGQFFNKKRIPQKGQMAPILDAEMVNSDDGVAIIAGGNMSAVKPQFGAYSAGRGVFMRIDSQRNIEVIDHQESGFYLDGEVRGIHPVKTTNSILYLIVKNDDKPVWFSKN